MWPREQHRRKIPTGASLGLTGKKSYGWWKSHGARGWMWLRHYWADAIIDTYWLTVLICSYLIVRQTFRTALCFFHNQMLSIVVFTNSFPCCHEIDINFLRERWYLKSFSFRDSGNIPHTLNCIFQEGKPPNLEQCQVMSSPVVVVDKMIWIWIGSTCKIKYLLYRVNLQTIYVIIYSKSEVILIVSNRGSSFTNRDWLPFNHGVYGMDE